MAFLIFPLPTRRNLAVLAARPPILNNSLPQATLLVFTSALLRVARERQAPLKGSSVTARVGIGRDERNRFKLRVALEVSAPGRDPAEVADMARVAHEEICPYSHATRGNIDVVVNVSNVAGQPQSA